MGWFDDIAQFLGGSGGQWVSSAINAGSRLAGTALTTSANNSAANQATAGMQQGADTVSAGIDTATPQYVDALRRALAAYTAGQDASVAAYNTGADRAGSRIDTIEATAQPAINSLRDASASNPLTLTPQQQIEYDDAARRGATTLSTSGLRGSGRATAAVMSDLQNRTRAGMQESNIQRQERARNLLAPQGFAATRDLANLDVQRGSVAANAASNVGSRGASTEEAIGTRTGDATMAKSRAQAAAQEGSGVIGANRTTANGTQFANAAGDIGNIFANTARGFSGTNRPLYRDSPTSTPRYNSSGQELYGPGYRAGGRIKKTIMDVIPSAQPRKRAA